MKKQTITFITGNAKKLEEIQAIIPYVASKNIDLPEIQSLSMQEIVAAKIKAALALCPAPVMVEDTAFYLDCLHSADGTPGLPGPFIKWFLQTITNKGLYDIAHAKKCMRAFSKTVIGYAPDAHTIHFFEGTVCGDVVLPEGDLGFGWDFIFKPDGAQKPLGAMNLQERIVFNQRGMVARKLKAFLQGE